MASAKSVAVQVQKLVNEGNEKGSKYNSAEATASRNWSERMSNTSHQREVKDLLKAGLNPVLSANSGAQSYVGASASAQAQNAGQAVAGLYEAEWSAKATRKAAATAAAATRYAAAQSAAATRDAAYAQAAAQKYASDMNYKTQKYVSDNSKSGTLPGILEKWLNKILSGDDTTKSQKSIIDNAWSAVKNYISSDAKASKAAMTTLNQFSIPNTSHNRWVVIQAAKGSSKYQKEFNKLKIKYKKK